ncbi:MAG: glycosyltransferase family 4 protein [Anaerolineales bacterium]|nr:glycosyltransferase family 4 protein [Anaerolineales bacterium]
MKILMIAPQPFFEPRGTPISVYQRLQALSVLGYQVDLVTYPLGIDVHIPGVKIHRSPSLPFIKSIKIGPSWIKLLLDVFLFFKAYHLLLVKRYEVIHTHEEAAFMALFLSKIFRTPHLYDMHSSLPKQLGNYNFGNNFPVVKIFEFLEKSVLRTSCVVLTIGEELDEHIRKNNGQINHIRIENRSTYGLFTPDESQIAQLRDKLGLEHKLPIVYTGSFERYQGLELLLRSAKEVVDKHPEAVFIFVGGNNGQVNRMKFDAIKLGLQDYCLFTGLVTLQESMAFLEVAEILVSPRTQGLSIPLKIYSYLASGKPIVATRVSAHTELLKDDLAVLVDSTPHSFAEGILKLIDDPELRLRTGQRAQQFAQDQFSQDEYLARLETAYLSIKHSKPISEILLQAHGSLKEFKPSRITELKT